MKECKCGCGTMIETTDSRGRDRAYVWGHAGRKQRVTRLCSCGCGQSFTKIISSNQNYIRNHHNARVGFQKGYTPWNKGKNYIPSNLRQFVEGGEKTRYKDGQFSKGKHPNWKGGITSESKLSRQKFLQKVGQEVLKRDNYTCQVCDQYGGDLHVDHIKAWADYPELRFDMSNCRTLCRACHYYVTFKRKMPSESKWGMARKRRIAL